MHRERAARGAEAADHGGRGVRCLTRGDLAQPEAAGTEEQIGREGTILLPEQSIPYLNRRRTIWFRCGSAHAVGAPGILGATTAAKNRYRSSSSPTKLNTSDPTTAASTGSGETVGSCAVVSSSRLGSISPPKVPVAKRQNVTRA